MNKTVLVAVCDFLVLSALSLSSSTKTSGTEVYKDSSQKRIVASDDFTKPYKTSFNDAEISNIEREKKVSDLNDKLGDLIKNTLILNKKLGNLEKSNTRLKIDKNSLLKIKFDLEIEKKTLNKDKVELKTKVADLAKNNRDLENVKTALEQKKLGLENKVADLAKNNTKLNNAKVNLEKLKLGLENKVANLAENKKVILKEKDELQNNKIELLKKLTNLETEKSSLQNQVESLKEDKDGLRKQVTGLEKDKDGLRGQIGSLEKDKLGLKQTVDKLEVSKQGLESKVANLAKNNTNLKDEKINLEKDKLNLKNNVDNLEKDKTSLISKVTALTNNIHKTVQFVKRKVNVSITETDKLMDDVNNLSFNSIVLYIKNQPYLISTHDKLGLDWWQIHIDGDIKDYILKVSKEDDSSIKEEVSDKLYYLNEDARMILIPVKKQKNAIKITGRKEAVEHLANLWLFKSKTGNLEKLRTANLTPDGKYINLEVPIQTRARNKPAIGDLVLSRVGKLIAIIVDREVFINNKIVYKAYIPEKDLSKLIPIDINNKKQFVKDAKKLEQQIENIK